MRKQRWLFSGGLFILIASVCLFIYPIATSLVVYTSAQKQAFLTRLQKPLEALAVEQAKALDPGYNWISYGEDYPEEIKDAIRDSVLTSQKAETLTKDDQALSSDSNLAWIVTYKGKSSQHNWKASYNAEPGSLDIVYKSGSGGLEIQQKAVDGYKVDPSILNTEVKTTLNPALTSKYGMEGDAKVSYKITLPEDFTIHFYAPSTLKANGSVLAVAARQNSWWNYMFIMGGGWLVIGLYILLWKKEVERQSFIFSRFIKMKTTGCWLVLISLTALLTYLAPAVSDWTATGTLREKLYSMNSSQAISLIPGFCYLIWFLYFCLAALTCMYIKYIFAFGIGRYIREESVISAIIRYVAAQAEDTARIPLNRWTLRKVMPVLIILDTIILGAILLGAAFWKIYGAVIAMIVINLLIVVAVRRIYKLWYQDYTITYKTAKELAEGNFSNVEPRQVGAFQNLYDSIIMVKSGFQTALNDALANQNMKTQLISNVSHDLKTPVTGIRSYAELITMTDDIDQIHIHSKKLLNYTDRLSSLIEDLFDVARANSGDIKLNPVTINLAELVEQVVVEWEDNLAAKHMHVVLELPPEALVNVDPQKTMRIVDNLMSNVNKYAMENTRVFVSLIEKEDGLELAVKNMSKTPLDFDANTITERFVRGDKSRHEPGTGLGLAIVKSFTEVQGGKCHVELDGDLFKCILTFPIYVPEPEPAPEASEETDSNSANDLPDMIG
ncbi:MAG: HAMP domain-containing histidine kinase [Erysipelotrichaceae bacterium]|nr:HAMP domain-containing histidine kinase [Erysipelotrichaceae bacterium]